MIPFARISKYGNVLKTYGMKQISSINLGHMFLTSEGDLYAYGKGNDYGRFGNGTKTELTTLTLVRSGVAQMYNSLSYTIILTNDGQYMASGLLAAFGVPDSPSFVDISSLFAQVPNIKQLVIDASNTASYSGCMAVLDNNGDCWMVGANSRYQFGNNTVTPSIGKFLKIQTGVKEIIGNVFGISWVYLKEDGTLYTTGGNIFTIGSENKTWLLLSTGILKAFIVQQRGVIFVKSDKKMYSRGYMVGAYGGSSTDVTEKPIITPFVYNYDTDVIMIDPYSTVYGGTVMIYNEATSKWYSGGTLSRNRMGTIQKSGDSWYEMHGTLPGKNDVLFVSGGGENSNIISKIDGVMHTSGAYSGSDGFSGEALVNYPPGYTTSTEYIISQFAV